MAAVCCVNEDANVERYCNASLQQLMAGPKSRQAALSEIAADLNDEIYMMNILVCASYFFQYKCMGHPN